MPAPAGLPSTRARPQEAIPPTRIQPTPIPLAAMRPSGLASPPPQPSAIQRRGSRWPAVQAAPTPHGAHPPRPSPAPSSPHRPGQIQLPPTLANRTRERPAMPRPPGRSGECHEQRPQRREAQARKLPPPPMPWPLRLARHCQALRLPARLGRRRSSPAPQILTRPHHTLRHQVPVQTLQALTGRLRQLQRPAESPQAGSAASPSSPDGSPPTASPRELPVHVLPAHVLATDVLSAQHLPQPVLPAP